MSYYQDWQTRSNDTDNPAAADAFIKSYYALEKDAYAAILADGESLIEGSAVEMAARLGFGRDMAIFLGFLDGIGPSLRTGLDLDLITDDSPVALDIDFPVLYRNMHAAKADWLYNLKEWNRVLPPDEQQRLTRAYRESKIIRHEKIGRNDPCPCGSGKKYKSCCGKGGPV